MDFERIKLPPELEETCLAKFDDLVSRAEIFYSVSTPEIVAYNGFKFEFRISPALLKKTILPRDAPGRSRPGGPFANPEEEFVMANVGSFHTLIFSKHCMYRPAFILHTKKFAPQSDDLDISDFGAAWAVLRHFQKPQMMIYNCGVDAGSSQGHKHMQIFPQPKEPPFELFPEGCRSTEVIEDSLPFIPHRHHVLSLPESAKAEDVFGRYQRLLAEVKGIQKHFGSGPAYNVALTSDWLCLIPRRHVNRDGVGANAAGMLGLVWLRDQEERDGWSRLGYTSHLEYLGIPIDTSKI